MKETGKRRNSVSPLSLLSIAQKHNFDLPRWEHQGHLRSSFLSPAAFAYLAGTVKSCPNGSEGLHYGSAIVAFDCIKGADPRKSF